MKLKTSVVNDYESVFGEKPPEDRLSILKNICKKNLLLDIAALNYRLLPRKRVSVNVSHDIQVQELEFFARKPDLFDKCVSSASRSCRMSGGSEVLFFTREACLFAIEEVMNSKTFHPIDGFKRDGSYYGDSDYYEAILIYLLAINYKIEELKGALDANYFEKLNAAHSRAANSFDVITNKDLQYTDAYELGNIKNLPWNDFFSEIDPLIIPYRGYCLIEFILHSTYKDKLVSYFADTYNLEPFEFILLIYKLYFIKEEEQTWQEIYYHWDEDPLDKIQKADFIIDKMSSSINIGEARFTNDKTEKLLGLRKYPFIKIHARKYILADNKFLIEKSYSQLINDFWFDKLKTGNREIDDISIQNYRSFIGKFHESYLRTLLSETFKNYEEACCLMFDDLKIKIKREEKEAADVYLRKSNKIFIAEAKAGSIYDKEKFGGSISKLYKKGRRKFYKDFGVVQLAGYIAELENCILYIDRRFPIGENLEFYPAIIVNDRIFQTPYWGRLFNDELQVLLNEKGIDRKRMNVRPLRIIFINDLERLEVPLSKDPELIWQLLEYNFDEEGYIYPFYQTLNEKLRGREYPNRVINLLDELVSRLTV